jgi:hypothetical protein
MPLSLSLDVLFPLISFSDIQQNGTSASKSANLNGISEGHFKCPHERLISHNWTVKIIISRIILYRGNRDVVIISSHVKNLRPEVTRN